jgi:biopolymer transport protein ExbD
MKSFLKKPRPSGDMELQITSMADIFMILLVFLLKSYSTSLEQINPQDKIKLPVVETHDTLKDNLKVEVSENSVRVDQKKVFSLNHFQLATSEKESKFIQPLYQELMSQRKKMPTPNTSSKLMILADEQVPFDTLKPILNTISRTGFVDLQLVVIAKE